MAIGNHIPLFGAAGNCGGIALTHVLLFDRIGHCLAHLTGGINVQLFKGRGPTVALVQRQGLAGILSVGQQFNSDVIGTDTVLIALILPSLGNGHAGLFRAMGVGHIDSVIAGRIIRHRILGNGVINRLAGCVFVQVFKGPLPVILRGDSLAGYLLAVGQQTDGNGIRTDAILVARILPGLGAGNGDLLHRMGVGDLKSVLHTPGDFGVVSLRQVHFLYRVLDGLPIGVHGQIGKTGCPLVILVEGYRFIGLIPIGQQHHLDSLGADAVLILRILPHLGDR